jgi:hypothetical protein
MTNEKTPEPAPSAQAAPISDEQIDAVCMAAMSTLGGGIPGDPSGELTAICKGLVAAVAFGDKREVSAMFDTPEQAHAFVRYLQRFMPPIGSAVPCGVDSPDGAKR